jgi:GDP-4-dehydro-6-deoxy-D-mannose reductase
LSDGTTLLLLGAGGFAGRNVRRTAADAGLDVVGAERSGAGGDLHCDLLEPDSIVDALRASRPDLVVNMAGAASVAASWERPADTFAANATGVLNLLEAVSSEAPEAHLTCVSSAEVYGEAADGRLPFTEDLPHAPLTPYGASKAAMEVICGRYARPGGLRIAVLRAFNQLGPGQSPEFVASGFAREVATAEHEGRDEAELAVGNISAARDFIDIRDAARAYVSVSRLGLTGTFNLCSGQAVPLQTLIDELGQATALKLRVRPSPELARPADPPLVYGSADRLREATGWQPQIPLPRTVADLLDFWRAELTGDG